MTRTRFEAALTTMLDHNHNHNHNRNLNLVADLRTLDGVEGFYVMVLDGYRQAYVGQTHDIRRRIKRHWAGTKQFDRLLGGEVHESVLSIDAFRALDTTRIYAAKSVKADVLETRIVSLFPADFLLNRINGGLMTGFWAMLMTAEIKRRQLAKD
ncbi:MAG TPA: GIY-YIG nuclease family protein [Leifsonia sp.]|jgi:hypothetical protein|nr:GIY-YIG nuclease family protein [Leifsonia sp.]